MRGVVAIITFRTRGKLRLRMLTKDPQRLLLQRQQRHRLLFRQQFQVLRLIWTIEMTTIGDEFFGYWRVHLYLLFCSTVNVLIVDEVLENEIRHNDSWHEFVDVCSVLSMEGCLSVRF
jgi:hypothetical protein